MRLAFWRPGRPEPDATQGRGPGMNPVHVNLRPDSYEVKRRHLYRILTCMEVVEGRLRPPDKIESFKAELGRRIGQLSIVGINVPPDRNAVKRMIEDLEAHGRS